MACRQLVHKGGQRRHVCLAQRSAQPAGRCGGPLCRLAAAAAGQAAVQGVGPQAGAHRRAAAAAVDGEELAAAAQRGCQDAELLLGCCQHLWAHGGGIVDQHIVPQHPRRLHHPRLHQRRQRRLVPQRAKHRRQVARRVRRQRQHACSRGGRVGGRGSSVWRTVQQRGPGHSSSVSWLLANTQRTGSTSAGSASRPHTHTPLDGRASRALQTA